MSTATQLRQDEEYVDLVSRVLRIDPERCHRFVSDFYQRLTQENSGSIADRVALLQDVYRAICPHRNPIPQFPADACCQICGQPQVEPFLAKKPDMVYGRCAHCGHGALLAPLLDFGIYGQNTYYQHQSQNGAGYHNYGNEKELREGKARRLLLWAAGRGSSPPGRFLEVGSGYGYTRKAAAGLGWQTDGADLNPFARQAAQGLYGFETFTGDLNRALEARALQPASYDLVLYQFVLEHVPDPVAELRTASRMLSPRGQLFLLLPGMDTWELQIFGASYRSLRADHLHIFSWRSLDLALQQAMLRRRHSTSECGVHLLSGFLNQQELDEMYEQGAGPDMLVLAGKES
jgi:SAM-dependent methyltransferase